MCWGGGGRGMNDLRVKGPSGLAPLLCVHDWSTLPSCWPFKAPPATSPHLPVLTPDPNPTLASPSYSPQTSVMLASPSI